MRNCPKCQRSNADDASFCSDCGHRFASQSSEMPALHEDLNLPFAVGAQVALGRYVIEAVLGQGGMGTVYRALDVSLDRRCALKVLNSELTAHPTARKRMEREARALARIEHPNVVQVRNIFLEGDLLVMELEYMDGGDLRSRVGPDGVGPAEAVAWMQGLLAGVQALHDAQLVHRDIKPENVLLSGQGVPKLTDLGVARDDAETGRTRTRLGAVLGTLEYMSPEQIQGLAVDARSDVYACGMVLYQLVTGALPFSAKSDFEWQEAHVRRAPDMGKLRAKARELVPVVERALAKAPEERWQSAAEMGAGLVGLAPVRRAVAAEAAVVDAEPVAVPPNGRLRVPVYLVVLFLLGVGALASIIRCERQSSTLARLANDGESARRAAAAPAVRAAAAPDSPAAPPEPATPRAAAASALVTVIGPLTWQTATASSSYNWADAKAYCGDLTLGTFSDWRLPTKKELDGTIDKAGTKCPYIVEPLKATTECDFYWSSTLAQGFSSSAWIVYFGVGISGDNHFAHAIRVRCVR